MLVIELQKPFVLDNLCLHFLWKIPKWTPEYSFFNKNGDISLLGIKEKFESHSNKTKISKKKISRKYLDSFLSNENLLFFVYESPSFNLVFPIFCFLYVENDTMFISEKFTQENFENMDTYKKFEILLFSKENKQKLKNNKIYLEKDLSCYEY